MRLPQASFPVCGAVYIRVAKGQSLAVPDESCSFGSHMANRSARATASLPSDVRLGLTGAVLIHTTEFIAHM
jgi:hypothetical protein